MHPDQRLAHLLRRLATKPKPEPAAAVTYGRRLPRRAEPARPAVRPRVILEEAVDGSAREVPGHGRAFVIESKSPVPDGLPEGGRGLLFFDIESTGLATAPLFLIGAMSVEDGNVVAGRMVVRQFLARNYAEESAVVRLFLDATERATDLVSFNGKSYDLPFIRTRAVLHRIPCEPDLGHIDLLHASRREWGHRLPNCRLQTLEREILKEPRPPDIPGGEIPDAYHAFVRSGDARDVVTILEHNRRDLVTLARLLSLLS